MANELKAPSRLSDLARASLRDYLSTLESRIERVAEESRKEGSAHLSSAEVLAVAKRLAPLPSPQLDVLDMDIAEGAGLALQEHLDRIRRSILLEARAISTGRSESEDQSIGPLDILNAATRYAPGTRVSTLSFSRRMTASVSMITLLSLFAAIVFGFLGLWPGTAQTVNNANGYLDIAKVFAGVVVGSAGAPAVTRTADWIRS